MRRANFFVFLRQQIYPEYNPANTDEDHHPTGVGHTKVKWSRVLSPKQLPTMHHIATESLTEGLQCLVTQLRQKKYPQLEALAKVVYSDTLAVQINDIHDADRRYSSLCIKLHDQVTQYLRLHQLVLIPYISDLIKKRDMGHDCRTCGGGCSLYQTAHKSDIREAQIGMKEILSWLDEAATNLAEFPQEWQMLRGNVSMLHIALTELFLIEESELIPMMIQLQKNIGVYV